MDSYQTIELSGDGTVSTVSLNRPEVRNAFNAQMISDLTRAFDLLAKNDRVRAVVLRGNGPSFSAGADVNWMRAALEFTPDENRADAARMSDMFETIGLFPGPVVGRVHGAALGGGIGLMAVCDIVVAADDAVFGFTEARLGIIPAVISPYVLPKIGESWARALYLTAERFGADMAQRIGLVHWLARPEELDAQVEQKVRDLLSSGPEAVRAAKKLVAQARAQSNAELREYTAGRIAALRSSREGQEGLRSFLEKRKPDWILPTPSASLPRMRETAGGAGGKEEPAQEGT